MISFLLVRLILVPKVRSTSGITVVHKCNYSRSKEHVTKSPKFQISNLLLSGLGLIDDHCAAPCWYMYNLFIHYFFRTLINLSWFILYRGSVSVLQRIPLSNYGIWLTIVTMYKEGQSSSIQEMKGVLWILLRILDLCLISPNNSML